MNKRANRHFHVVRGSVVSGPLVACATRVEARKIAVASARVAREEGFRVTGNATSGYAVGELREIKVTDCTDPLCVIG